MGILDEIMKGIYGASSGATPAGGIAGAASSGAGNPPPSPAASPGGLAGGRTGGVGSILDMAAAAKGEKLEWRTSIVDLMKTLDIDSSLAARKELARELGYAGDTSDSASMNVWLQTQMITRIEASIDASGLPGDPFTKKPRTL